MPNIVHWGRVHMTDEVYHIADTAPKRKKKRPRPEFTAEGVPEGAAEGQEPEEGAAPGEGGYDEYEEYEDVDHSPQIQAEIIQSAMAEAARIVQEATQEAEAQKQEMLAQVQYEAEKIRADAAEEGQRHGYASVVGEMKEIAGSVEQAIARFEGDRAGFEAEYEEQLTWMAFEIASKVLAKKVAQDDTEMLQMVEKAVRSVQNETWVRVEVSQEMTRLIGRLTEIFDAQANVEISAVPATPGSVQIETPSGVVDASLKTQLENLRQYFEQTAT